MEILPSASRCPSGAQTPPTEEEERFNYVPFTRKALSSDLLDTHFTLNFDQLLSNNHCFLFIFYTQKSLWPRPC
jgi:hypothetical protein